MCDCVVRGERRDPCLKIARRGTWVLAANALPRRKPPGYGGGTDRSFQGSEKVG